MEISRGKVLLPILILNALTFGGIILFSFFLLATMKAFPEFPGCGEVSNPEELHEYLAGVAEKDKAEDDPFCAAAVLTDEWILCRRRCLDDYGYDLDNSEAVFNIGRRDSISRDIVDNIPVSFSEDDSSALVLLSVSPPLDLHEPGVVTICLPPADADISDKIGTAIGWRVMYNKDTIPKRPEAIEQWTQWQDMCPIMYGGGPYSHSICNTMLLDPPNPCPVDKSSMLVLRGKEDDLFYVVGLSGRRDAKCNHTEYTDITQYSQKIIDTFLKMS